MLLNLLGNPFLNSRTILDNFKDFLLLSSIFRVMQANIQKRHASAIARPVSTSASFGFGWWYYAQTEGAPALA
jgi:hypothetical protein